MKIAPLFAILTLGSLVGACSSLDSPFSGLASNPLLNTGRDARVYNGNTGYYEWPNTTPTPRPKATPKPTPTPAVVVIRVTPKPAATPAKSAFPQGKTPSATPAVAEATPVVVEKKATPTPVPARATGVLNMETGKIDWTEAGVPPPKKPVAPPAPTPTPKSTPKPKRATPTPPSN